MMLNAGEIFFTKNPMALGRLINAVQRFWSSDNSSIYSHAGIISSTDGKTYEALWTIGAGNLSAYKGQQVAIFRYNKMTSDAYESGMSEVSKQKGRWYPAYRLVLMLIPPIGKYLNFNRPVCSELVAMFLEKIGVDIRWQGMNPDELYDFVKNHRDFTIIYRGEWV